MYCTNPRIFFRKVHGPILNRQKIERLSITNKYTTKKTRLAEIFSHRSVTGPMLVCKDEHRLKYLPSYVMFTEHIISSSQTRQLHINVLLSLSIIRLQQQILRRKKARKVICILLSGN